MSTSTQPRVKSGSTAGRWATRSFTEPSFSLGSTFSDSTLSSLVNASRHKSLAPIGMTPEILGDIRTHLDVTGDFSGTRLREVAEGTYERQNGYTADEYQHYLTTHGDTSAYFADPEAVRRDIEQIRKDLYAGRPSV